MKQEILPITEEETRNALQKACSQVELNLPYFTENCQNHSSVNLQYPICPNDQWTCGFWTGEIWLSYEFTGKELFKNTALIQVDGFLDRIRRKIELDHHDMGFLYSPSCVAAYKLTGSENGKQAALAAADQLMTRFQKKGQFLQAWGEMGAADNYRFIIDCMLNLPLLYWAYGETGNEHFMQVAKAHTKTCLKYSFRPDGSTYHTFYMNLDGTPKGGRTAQGYRDDSAWARGQAWGIYGSALGFTYTRDPAFLPVFDKALNFYLSRLPDDLIPCWDLIFQPDSGEPRDSSAAAVTICGLLEMAKQQKDLSKAGYYRELAGKMLNSLYRFYTAPELLPKAGQILHGTYSKKSPYNTCIPEGVDEYTSWGDYFYMEGLTRYLKDWKMYW